jgi:hypothetical protein
LKIFSPNTLPAIAEEMRVLTPEEQTELGRLLRKLGLGLCEKAHSAAVE